MSWSFTATAKSKESLKAHSRKQLLAYHTEGTPGHALMTRVAEHVDGLIDLFELGHGLMVRLETSGHLEKGSGSCKFELTNYCGVLLD